MEQGLLPNQRDSDIADSGKLQRHLDQATTNNYLFSVHMATQSTTKPWQVSNQQKIEKAMLKIEKDWLLLIINL